VIPRNTIIPARKTVNIKVPGGSKLIKVIEGERLRAQDNRLIGEINVSSISPKGKTDNLIIAMEVDVSYCAS